MEAVINKIDLAKADKNYYGASLNPEVKDLDRYYYLSLSGQCSPEDQEFNSAIETVYAVAYALKFLCKGEDNDFVVPKMECQWYIEGGLEKQHLFNQTPRDQWCWKIMLRMPDVVGQDHFDRAVSLVKEKNVEEAESYDRVSFELVNEGKCVQIMHIGSWEEEGPSLQRIFSFMESEGLNVRGYHKEIYISEPNRVAEARKKTILRYQVD